MRVKKLDSSFHNVYVYVYQIITLCTSKFNQFVCQLYLNSVKNEVRINLTVLILILVCDPKISDCNDLLDTSDPGSPWTAR